MLLGIFTLTPNIRIGIILYILYILFIHVNSPSKRVNLRPSYSKPDKTGMEQAYADIIGEIDDLERTGLKDTPGRAADAMRFLTRGYNQNLEEIINNARFPTERSEMVVVQDIELYSLCEHHLLPFVGKCHVAYIPNKFVIGLSKIARIVDMYARRLQNQENLTMDIARAMNAATDVEDVAVIIESKHLCMMMRGVEKQNSVMKTSAMLGIFRSNPSTRAELFSLLKST